MATVSIYVHDLRLSGVVCNAMAIADRLAEKHTTTLVSGSGKGFFSTSDVPRRFAMAVLSDDHRGPLPRATAGLRLAAYLGDRPGIVVSAGNFGHPSVWVASRRRRRVRSIYCMSNELSRDGDAFAGLRVLWARMLAADAARIISVGTTIAASPGLQAPLADGRCVFVPNGVDIVLARRLCGMRSPHPWFDDDVPVVLGIGRLRPQKNFPALIDATAAVRRRRRLRLMILGGGTPEARLALESRAAAAGLGDDFLLAGEIGNVFPWLGRAAVFALPSRYEGSSIALLEALACGVPVVAHERAGDAADVLDRGRFGRLADAGDAAAFGDAIASQIGPDRITPGDRAESYSLDRMLDAYAGIVDAVADTGSDRSGRRRAPQYTRAFGLMYAMSSLSV